MNRLDVKTSKLPFVMTILLGLFFVPIGLGMLVSGLTKGFAPVPLLVGFMSLASFATVLFLVRRGHSNSVKTFSETGVARNDGTSFPWTDLVRVEQQVRTAPGGRKAIWRTEIQFRDGQSAWLIPTKVSNFDEVYTYVNQLPCDHVEKNVGSLR